jgi:hypothetical protein
MAALALPNPSASASVVLVRLSGSAIFISFPVLYMADGGLQSGFLPFDALYKPLFKPLLTY